MSQTETVRRMLEAGWVCGTEFLDERIPRYGARFDDLKRQGVLVEKRRCLSHKHRSAQWEFQIATDAADVVIPTTPLSGVLGVAVGDKYFTGITNTLEWPSGENLVLTFQDGIAQIRSEDSP